MLEDKLNAIATKQQRISKKVLCWKLSNNNISFLKYLYWRNRYPILSRLTSRLLLLFEIYLLSHLFNIFTATSFGLIMFVLYYFREIHRGFIQAVKRKIIKSSYGIQSILPLVNKTIFISFNFALILITAILCVGLYTDQNIETLAFIASWYLILPLQLASNSSWSILYTFRRARRSFLLVLFLRLLPSLHLLFFAKNIGIYAYIIGILIGRSVEYLYLTKIAYSQFVTSKEIAVDKFKTFFNKIIKENKIQIVFPVPFVFYNVFLSILLFLRNKNEWLDFFFLLYLYNIFSYIILRAPQSLVMDFFLSLKSLNISQAKNWLKKARKLQKIATFLVVVLVVGLVIILQKYNLDTFNKTLIFLPYLILMLVSRAAFQFRYMYCQTALIESFYIYKVISLVSVFSLIQYYCVSIGSADLNLVILVDSVLHLILMYAISIENKIEDSPILNTTKLSLPSNLKLPYEIRDTQFNHGKNFIGLLDSEYSKKNKVTKIYNYLSDILGEGSFFQITPGLILLHCEDFKIKKINLELPSVFRSIDKVPCSDKDLIKLSLAYKSLTSNSKSVNRLLAVIDFYLYNDVFKPVIIKSIASEDYLIKYLEKEFSCCKQIVLNSEEIVKASKSASLDHLKYAHSRLRSFTVRFSIIEEYPKNLCVFIFNDKEIIIDYSNLDSCKITHLKSLSVILNNLRDVGGLIKEEKRASPL